MPLLSYENRVGEISFFAERNALASAEVVSEIKRKVENLFPSFQIYHLVRVKKICEIT